MKKLGVFILLFSFVILSCNSDDDNNNPEDGNQDPTSELLGNWKLISFSQQGEVMTITDCEKRSTITFTADSYTDIGYAPVNDGCQIDYEDNGTWVEDGNKLTLTYSEEGETFVDEATFTVVDNVLTITYNDEGFITASDYEKI